MSRSESMPKTGWIDPMLSGVPQVSRKKEEPESVTKIINGIPYRVVDANTYISKYSEVIKTPLHRVSRQVFLRDMKPHGML